MRSDLRPAWFLALFLAVALATALSCGVGGGDDDDNDTADDGGDGSFNDELQKQCVEFVSECLGISQASAKEHYCSFFEEYKGQGACVDKALRAFLLCVMNNFDCETGDPHSVDGCTETLDAELAACNGETVDDDTGDDDDDDTGDDDHWTDDDDDDTFDDDADDDTNDEPPQLFGGIWDPNPPGDDYLSALSFQLCDPDDDLSGGTLYVWFSGTSQPAFSDHLPWDDQPGGAPHAPDCGNPRTVLINVDLSANEGLADDLCVDIQATDGAANESNKLTNVCVYVP